MKILASVWTSLKPMASGLAFGLVGGLLALLVARLAFPPPTFIALDLAGVVKEQAQSLVAHQDMDDAGKAQASATFAKQLDVQSRAMAADYHAIVLAAPAVVGGVPDLTPELRQRVAVAMATQGITAAAPPSIMKLATPVAAQPVQSGAAAPALANPMQGATLPVPPSSTTPNAFWGTPAVGSASPRGGQP